MNNKESIINKIIQDATDTAKSNLEKANIQAQEIISTARQKAEELKEQNKEKPNAIANDIIARSLSVSKLDCRKLTLVAKKQIIDDIFGESIEYFRFKKSKEYVGFVNMLIEKNAQDGDEVIVCEKDKDFLDKVWLEKLAKKIKKNITLSKEVGEFNGGIILSSKTYDKNLTLDLELEVMREDIEKQVSEILFKEK